jgi:hypothetical protein
VNAAIWPASCKRPSRVGEKPFRLGYPIGENGYLTSGRPVQLPPAPVLTCGPGLVLRRPVPADMDDIIAKCRDPEFQRWTTVPVPYRDADARGFFERVAQGWRADVAAFTIAHEGRYAGGVDLRFDGLGGAGLGADRVRVGSRCRRALLQGQRTHLLADSPAPSRVYLPGGGSQLAASTTRSANPACRNG